MDKKYVVFGGVAGGLGAALRLRRLDERAKITLFETGQTVAFDISGLPYYIGGIVKHSGKEVFGISNSPFNNNMPTPGHIKKMYNVDVKVNMDITGINRREKKVEVKNLVTGRKYIQKYDKLVLAPGPIPFKPDIKGIESEKIFGFASIADCISIAEYITTNSVKRAVIVGGGYIGLEIAENMAKLGITTQVVEQSGHVLQAFDLDMSQFAAEELKENGVIVTTGVSVVSFNKNEGEINVVLSNGSIISTDMVIVAAGTVQDVSLAKKAGLGIGLSGGILVDDRQQTTDKDIYAVGDAVEVECLYSGKEFTPHASTAERQARIAADNICGIASRYKKTLGITLIKLFNLTLACAGLSEKSLKERKENFEKIYIRSYYGAVCNKEPCLITTKIMFEKKSGRILGVQTAGRDGVDKLIDVYAAAMRYGITADKLSDMELAYAPPFGTPKDPANIAGCIVSDIIAGLADVVQWDDIKRMKGCFLVDVRSKAEFEEGTIKGAISIPIIELRERASQLPKDKTIILFCGSGQDAYTAQRMLKQRGYDARYLSGGYGLYEIFNRKKAAK